jgi:hypothetical protein
MKGQPLVRTDAEEREHPAVPRPGEQALLDRHQRHERRAVGLLELARLGALAVADVRVAERLRARL